MWFPLMYAKWCLEVPTCTCEITYSCGEPTSTDSARMENCSPSTHAKESQFFCSQVPTNQEIDQFQQEVCYIVFKQNQSIEESIRGNASL